jgi:NADH-quinone oxidoreductase subunit G
MSGYLAALIQKVADSETANRLGEQAAGFYESLPRVDGIAQSHAAHISNAILSLKKSQRPVIVCGTDIVADPIPGLAADLALFLHAMGKKSGLFYVLPGANAFGAGVLSGKEQTLLQVIEGIENGLIKALILVESDPWRYFADRPRLVKAFEKLELLIVLDYIGSGVVQAAHIFIPSATMYEAGGVFINQEGRLQRVPAAFAGGIPIAQTGRGDHPPRRYGTGLPGGETFPAWTVLAELAALRSPGDRPAARTDIWRWLAEFLPGFAELPAFEQIPAQGVRCNPGVNTDLRFATRWPLPLESVGARNNRLELIRVDWTFGTEELSWFSECLRELEQPPCIFMHSRDAGNQGLGDGDQVAIRTDKGLLETRLRVAENMAGGVVIVPRHAKINWQIFATGARHIFRDQIRKVTTQ